MDPITRAMQRLADDAEAFWGARPNHLLPLLADEDQQADLVQALRLYEARPENRRPVVVLRAPFEAATPYVEALAEQIAGDYERVRVGAAEEGVELPPFGGDEDTVPSGALSKRVVLAMNRAAARLGERFDGIVIALVPDHVADEPGWREGVRVLAATRWAPRVRLAVQAPPGGVLADILGPLGARFRVDHGAMLAFLRERLPEPSTGSSATAISAQLPALLLRAAESMAAGLPAEAAETYREARALCQIEGLIHQEAAVTVALGGACLAARALDLAARSYHDAAALAETVEEWPLACQAWLGAGGAYLTQAEHAPAAVSYEAAAAAAKSGGDRAAPHRGAADEKHLFAQSRTGGMTMGTVIAIVSVGAALNLALWGALYHRLRGLPVDVWKVAQRSRVADENRALDVLQAAAASGSAAW